MNDTETTIEVEDAETLGIRAFTRAQIDGWDDRRKVNRILALGGKPEFPVQTAQVDTDGRVAARATAEAEHPETRRKSSDGRPVTQRQGKPAPSTTTSK